jgi:hypothetical protein
MTVDDAVRVEEQAAAGAAQLRLGCAVDAEEQYDDSNPETVARHI